MVWACDFGVTMFYVALQCTTFFVFLNQWVFQSCCVLVQLGNIMKLSDCCICWFVCKSLSICFECHRQLLVGVWVEGVWGHCGSELSSFFTIRQHVIWPIRKPSKTPGYSQSQQQTKQKAAIDIAFCIVDAIDCFTFLMSCHCHRDEWIALFTVVYLGACVFWVF